MKVHGDKIGCAEFCLQDAADRHCLILTDDQVDERRRPTDSQIDWSATANDEFI